MKSWYKIGCWVLMVWMMLSCTQEHIVESEGNASLTIKVATSVISRAQAPGDGDIVRGGGMEDLTVLLVNSSGVVAAKQQVTNLTGEEQKFKVVTIDNLEIGNYTLYAFGNTENSLLTEAKTMLENSTEGSTFGETQKNALFTELTDTDVPTMGSEKPLLLTASKEVAIGLQDNHASIELLRPIVWFEVKLYNHSEKNMTVSSLSFSDFNPSTGYLLPHDGAIPSSVTYRSLPAYGGGVTVNAETNATIYETALFENAAANYIMNMTLQTSEASMQNANSIANTTTQYALKNRSTGSYLVDNGTTLEVVDYNGVVDNNALWTFSSISKGYITNVGTGNKYYCSKSAEESKSDLTFQSTNNYLQIYYTTGNGKNRQMYYLKENDGTVNYATGNNNNSNWLLQQINQSIVEANLEDVPLMTINNETASVEPMTRQIRNQHITVTVNAYYNEQEGLFKFEVKSWNDKQENVEFN